MCLPDNIPPSTTLSGQQLVIMGAMHRSRDTPETRNVTAIGGGDAWVFSRGISQTNDSWADGRIPALGTIPELTTGIIVLHLAHSLAN